MTIWNSAKRNNTIPFDWSCQFRQREGSRHAWMVDDAQDIRASEEEDTPEQDATTDPFPMRELGSHGTTSACDAGQGAAGSCRRGA